MIEQKAIHGMTNLLQWGAGSLLEACSTFAIPCASPAARSSCFSQEGDGSAGQEEGFSFPLPISGLLHSLHWQTQTEQ